MRRRGDSAKGVRGKQRCACQKGDSSSSSPPPPHRGMSDHSLPHSSPLPASLLPFPSFLPAFSPASFLPAFLLSTRHGRQARRLAMPQSKASFLPLSLHLLLFRPAAPPTGSGVSCHSCCHQAFQAWSARSPSMSHCHHWMR